MPLLNSNKQESELIICILNDLMRHDNLTGLNDLNSLFGLRKSKAVCALIAG